jgi:hypothetical protein
LHAFRPGAFGGYALHFEVAELTAGHPQSSLVSAIEPERRPSPNIAPSRKNCCGTDVV